MDPYLFFTCKGCGVEQPTHIRISDEDLSLVLQDGPDEDGREIIPSDEAHRCNECGETYDYLWPEFHREVKSDGG